MNKRTLKALRGSIKKWHDIRYNDGIDRGPDNCPLCHEFYDQPSVCFSCPVSNATGCYFCHGSPYDRWDEILGPLAEATTPAQKAAAKAELDFLVTLLPEGETYEVDGWCYYWTWTKED